MSYEKFEEPVEALVWFEGGERRSALVVGEWNGFAVAEASVAVASAILRDGGLEVEFRPASNKLYAHDEDGSYEMQVRQDGRVLLDDGWALLWEPAPRASGARRVR